MATMLRFSVLVFLSDLSTILKVEELFLNILSSVD